MKEGWEEKRIDEVCSIARGGSPRPIKNYITNDSNGLNWIKIGDTDMGGKYIYSTKEKIRPEGLKKSRWVEEDEFLLSNSMSFGRPYILKTNGCIHDGWLVLRDYQKYLNIEFFYYVLSSEYVQNQFRTKAQGSTVSNLNTDRVASVTIPVPPLSEQQRIVDYLDATFAKIDAMKANAGKALNEVKALFQAALKEMLEPKEGWEEKKLKEITSEIGDGLHGTPKYTDDGNYYFVNGNNFENGLIKIKDNTKRVGFEEYEKYRINLNSSTVLLSINGTIGKTAFYNGESIILGKSACYINVLPTLLKEYLRFFLLSEFFMIYANKNARQATIINLGLKEIRNMPIPIPPLSEQQRIVETLDSLKSKVDRLQANFDKVTQECDALKQAILRQVFE